MNRKLKALGLALFACLALGAVAAQGAMAENDIFTSNSDNELTNLTGTSEVSALFRGGVEGSEITCKTGNYAGTIVGNNVDEITVHPEYGGHTHAEETEHTGCEAGGFGATVTTDGCEFVLSGETHDEHATVAVECTDEKEITIDVTDLNVKIHIPSQDELLGVTYTNIPTGGGPHGEVTLEATVEGITSTCTGGALACFLAGGAVDNEGVYEDHVVVKGFEDSESFIQNEETHEWSGSHGSQVDIGVETE
jgi:hypothetical protein